MKKYTQEQQVVGVRKGREVVKVISTFCASFSKVFGANSVIWLED